MRKVLTIAAAALAAVFLAGPVAAAQGGGGNGSAQQQQGERLPPSAAVKLAMAAMPGAEALGVKLRGDTYIVRLKQGGSIVQVGVNAVTGDVTPLQ